MNMNKNQDLEGQAARTRAGLKWLGVKAREIKFGTLRGLLVRDGGIVKGSRYRAERTGKPRRDGQPVKLVQKSALDRALRDLELETAPLRGVWKLRVNVANGTLLNWTLEEPETSKARENE